jgi:hypothetical protein
MLYHDTSTALMNALLPACLWMDHPTCMSTQQMSAGPHVVMHAANRLGAANITTCDRLTGAVSDTAMVLVVMPVNHLPVAHGPALIAMKQWHTCVTSKNWWHLANIRGQLQHPMVKRHTHIVARASMRSRALCPVAPCCCKLAALYGPPCVWPTLYRPPCVRLT